MITDKRSGLRTCVCIVVAVQIMSVSSLPKPNSQIPLDKQWDLGERYFWNGENSFKQTEQEIAKLKGIENYSLESLKELDSNENTNDGVHISKAVQDSISDALDGIAGALLDKANNSSKVNGISNSSQAKNTANNNINKSNQNSKSSGQGGLYSNNFGASQNNKNSNSNSKLSPSCLHSIVNRTLLEMGINPCENSKESSQAFGNGGSSSSIGNTPNATINDVLQQMGIISPAGSASPTQDTAVQMSHPQTKKKLESIVNNTLLQMGVNPGENSSKDLKGAASIQGNSSSESDETADKIANDVLQDKRGKNGIDLQPGGVAGNETEKSKSSKNGNINKNTNPSGNANGNSGGNANGKKNASPSGNANENPANKLKSIVNNTLLRMGVNPGEGSSNVQQGAASTKGNSPSEKGSEEAIGKIANGILQELGGKNSTNTQSGGLAGNESSKSNPGKNVNLNSNENPSANGNRSMNASPSGNANENIANKLKSIVNNTLLQAGVNPGNSPSNDQQGSSSTQENNSSQNKSEKITTKIANGVLQEIGFKNNTNTQAGGVAGNETGNSNASGGANGTASGNSGRNTNENASQSGKGNGNGNPNENGKANAVASSSGNANGNLNGNGKANANAIPSGNTNRNPNGNGKESANQSGNANKNITNKLKSIVNKTLLQMGVSPSEKSPNKPSSLVKGNSSSANSSEETSTKIASSVLKKIGAKNNTNAKQGKSSDQVQSTSLLGDELSIPSQIFLNDAMAEMDSGLNEQGLSTGSKSFTNSIENKTVLDVNPDSMTSMSDIPDNIVYYKDGESSGDNDGSGSGDNCKGCTECYGCFIPCSVLQNLKTPCRKEYCRSNPCLNNGTCIESRSGFTCLCPKGFKGYTCEDVNFCDPNPCNHDGMCIEKHSSYKCVCKPGYKGTTCQDVDPCSTNPCQNGGTCTDINSKANCTCQPRYSGQYCEVPKICYENPCHNGATCVENILRPCICRKGFTGRYCSGHVCDGNPCLNGGSCEITPATEGGDSMWKYKCRCPALYKGKRCEVPHFCAGNPCQNGGSCVEMYESNGLVKTWVSVVPNAFFKCICPQGFSGKQCEIDVCDSCDENAVCVDHRCVCKSGYTGNGFDCTKMQSPCRPNPCINGATCTVGPDLSYDCKCVKGYCGQHCEVICDICVLKPCQNGGSCYPKGTDDRYCVCPPKYTGPDCNIKIPDPCKPNPCLHYATCTSLPEQNDFTCRCLGKYSGKTCENCGCPKAKIIPGKVTYDSYCNDYGECYCQQIADSSRVTFSEGEGCVAGRSSHLCYPNPCLHGGTCKITASQVETCLCVSPYYGDRCQFLFCNISNPCQNGGSCIDVGVKDYTCKCTPQFTGVNCTESVPDPKPETLCEPSPCINGGTCKERGNGYDCFCYDRFTGPNCEVDRCADCDVNADCVQGHCVCRYGYIGTGYLCELEEEESECGVCPTHHQCSSGQCICIPGTTCTV